MNPKFAIIFVSATTVAGLSLYYLFNYMLIKSNTQQPGGTLVERVSHFRKMGFFSDYKDLDNQALANRLEKMHGDEWGEPINLNDKLADLEILAMDTKRVWWQDTECDVSIEDDAHAQILREWAAISRGAFDPQEIKENWTGERGAVEITFTLNGTACKLNLNEDNDWIDISVINDINKLIEGSGYQFEVYAPFDQSMFIVVLDNSEKERLKRERGWQFAE